METSKVYFDKDNNVWYRFFKCGFDDKPMVAVSISDTEDRMGVVYDESLQRMSYDEVVENFIVFKSESENKTDK